MVGLGTTIIERSLLPYGGSAETCYSAFGLTCEIRLPLPDDDPNLNVVSDTPEDLAVKPKILVVEDEPLLAMEIEADLQENDFLVVGPAYDLETARQAIADHRCDAVLLDANLHGKRADEFADILVERKIPFVFVSGYGREALPPKFKNVPLVSKPFDPKHLVSVLTDVLRQHLAGTQG
nr:response regulator [Rhizobium sp. ARZ01]